MDIVTVYHNDTSHDLAQKLHAQIGSYEKSYEFIEIDNRLENRGFSAACNLGALYRTLPNGRWPASPIIGFLNPDTQVHGPFIKRVSETLRDRTAITGCRFGKPDNEVRIWGLSDWVCGAAMFVRRDWFEFVNGFDERYVWSWEETDLIRLAQEQGYRCKSISLPILHESPTENSQEDSAYKNKHFEAGKRLYYEKWRTRRAI